MLMKVVIYWFKTHERHSDRLIGIKTCFVTVTFIRNIMLKIDFYPFCVFFFIIDFSNLYLKEEYKKGNKFEKYLEESHMRNSIPNIYRCRLESKKRTNIHIHTLTHTFEHS